jgi:hypothetical protein
LWYYLSEARPYIILFAFSALTAACLFRLRQDSGFSTETRSWFRFFALGIVGVCATNLVAVPWAICAIGAFAFWVGPRTVITVIRRSAGSSGVAFIALTFLCSYYVWSLRLGARASEVGRTGLVTVGFVFYELLGISGLGPGRVSLREEGTQALVAYALVLIAGVAAVLILCAASISEVRKEITRRDLIFWGIAAAMPAAILTFAGTAMHMRLLGRHFIPFLPFILAFLAIGLKQLLAASHSQGRVVAGVTTVILLLSALEIRFAPRHRRDDYRSAANLVRSAVAAGERVWWLADETAGAYYNLPLNSSNLSLPSTLSNSSLATLPAPDLVCLSKPDIYDTDGTIRQYVREHDFRVKRVLPAFQIFEHQPAHR